MNNKYNKCSCCGLFTICNKLQNILSYYDSSYIRSSKTQKYICNKCSSGSRKAKVKFTVKRGIRKMNYPTFGTKYERSRTYINHIYENPYGYNDNILYIGKYIGKTFKYIYDNHGNYCDWIIRNSNHSLSLASIKMKEFLAYILGKKKLNINYH